jgi:hypothetical protein
MPRYAIVDSEGLVTNVAIWDGQSDWAPGDGAILIPDGVPCGPGYTYDGSAFIAPPYKNPLEP